MQSYVLAEEKTIPDIPLQPGWSKESTKMHLQRSFQKNMEQVERVSIWMKEKYQCGTIRRD